MRTRTAAKRETPAASVGRVTAVLDLFADSGEDLGVTEIAEQLGLAKSVVHRLVSALSNAGYLLQDSGTRRYTLGPKATRLGQASLGDKDIRLRARPHLVKLAAKTGETATFSVLVGDQRSYAEAVDSSQPVRQTVQIGALAPLHVGASGKAILAFLTDEHREAILARLPRTGVTLANGGRRGVDALRKDLEMVHKRGFAVSEAERITGATSAAAPVFDHHGDVIGAISVASVSMRHTGTDLLGFGELARQQADRLSRELGSSARSMERRGA
jgi:DNA-binding IclR family transcriptional regulator